MSENRGPPQLSLQDLMFLVKQYEAQQQTRPDAARGLPMGNTGMMQPGQQQLQGMQQAYNQQPLRADAATGMPMGNTGMMQPGMQDLLAMQAAAGPRQQISQGPPPGFAGPPPPPMMGGGMPQGPIKSFKKGGTVEKTGVYRLHKGERVIKAPKTKTATSKTARKASAKKPSARMPARQSARRPAARRRRS
jgi:hypothetical protein